MVSQESFDLNPNYKTYKNQTLAWKLFATANAEKEATYKNRTWSIYGNVERLSDQKYTLTGDGYLYLEKIKSEMETKIFTTLIAVFSAVLAAALTFYVGKI